ncbi:hypothetical protein HOO54_21615 [Bacillus sp. WMMC1349]|uniref:hypothetical protein n=1 Tax=Bacillus sp. WMMC1349 TaxID=2736254 RepID=UPI001557944C|nr:hypothetical protein [Bacillus sp. WMMC1349]NPC94750.1 hypothetical protein [Bacillus sp. WMMC1349]
MNNLKMKVWNINGRSGVQRENEPAYTIPLFIASELMGKNPDASTADIIVLTEFVITTGWGKLKYNLEKNGYSLFISHESGQNGILIALKNIEGLNLESVVSTSEMNTEKVERPNFLQVTVKYNGKSLSIIGVRIRVDKKISQKDFLDRREQLEALIDHLSTLENIIVGGDFNNAKINGNLARKYSEVREEYRYTSKGELNVSYDTYNYHILKDAIEERGYFLHTPKGNVPSWGNYFKLDHIITSKSIAASNVEYSWSFKNKKNGYGEFTTNDIRLPDHAILSADISID